MNGVALQTSCEDKLMTAKLELRENFKLGGKWADRLTNLEAEDVLSELTVMSQAHDASHGAGDFQKSVCEKVAWKSAMKKLAHRGIPREKLQ
jgi:hypothetical protein